MNWHRNWKKNKLPNKNNSGTFSLKTLCIIYYKKLCIIKYVIPIWEAGKRDHNNYRESYRENGYKFNKIAMKRRARMIYTKLLIDIIIASRIKGTGRGERFSFFNLCNLL